MPDAAAGVRARYEACGQGHVFRHWDRLDAADRDVLVAQAAQIPIEQVSGMFAASMRSLEAADAAPVEADDVHPLDADHVVTSPSAEAVAEWRARGLRMIAEGQTAALVLAGGQGTRLGSPLPKGLLDLQLPSGLTIFELMAQRILKLQQLARDACGLAGRIHWYVMTSDATHEPIVAFFQSRKHLGLDADTVHFFKQGFLPAFSVDGKVILATQSSLGVAPDGNGGLYRALESQGILARMEQAGVEYVQVFNVDNLLAKVADPVFFGFSAAHKVDCAAKTVPKVSPDEKVGVFAVHKGRKGVIEYTELGATRAAARRPDGSLLYNEANIAIYCYSVPFLRAIVTHHMDTLPYHVARKDVPSVDGVVPGVKLEAFIFDVFQFAERFYLLSVHRCEEFSGIKNANGPGKVDTPDTARADLYALHRRWIAAAGGTVEGDGPVEVCPLVSYAGEGLEERCGGKGFPTPVLLEPSTPA
jgi:UDP-N-acetylglucosamine/UDP-N-acetylgalactosamine diphosphorylase